MKTVPKSPQSHKSLDSLAGSKPDAFTTSELLKQAQSKLQSSNVTPLTNSSPIALDFKKLRPEENEQTVDPERLAENEKLNREQLIEQ